MNTQLGFHHDMRRCTGCRACVMACRSANHLEYGLQWREVIAYREDPEAPGRHFLSLSCNHCESPECLRVCKEGAFQKQEDGAVLHLADRCTGCRLCTLTCPYGAPRYSATLRKVSKCNLCPDRLAQGLQPACVAACPTGALSLVNLRQFDQPAATSAVPGFPTSDITTPSVRFTVPDARRGRRKEVT
jgi:Fe-S-cluster-containing dehydrogenase component